MTIYVCSMPEMPRHVETLRPSHLVSLVPPLDQPPTPPQIAPERHLRLSIDDITEPLAGYVLPDVYHIATLVDFLMGRADDEPILLHCVAGVSRSMAAALIALTLDAEGQETEMALRLRRAAPHARPNTRMVALADDVLCRDGRLVEACRRMGPATDTLPGPLVRLSPFTDVQRPAAVDLTLAAMPA
ncbi:MAG: tyrosine phosphatase family protein [Rhodospirillales bacterium]